MYLNEEFETLLTRVEDRLTVTLDVFKFYYNKYYFYVYFWLTVTLDVFKLLPFIISKASLFRLTVTLDVFK